MYYVKSIIVPWSYFLDEMLEAAIDIRETSVL
jgi:hypothetical protein